MSNKAILHIQNLVAQYDEDIILKNINLDVDKGEILVIIGGSGCGKSTLLKHMVGLIPPFSGKVFIEDVDITSCSDKELNNALRKIGVLFQSSALFGSMTLAENVALPLLEYTDLPKNAINTLVQMKLCIVDLAQYANHLPSELSGGMKKRAGLARALALNPEILFLDEPTAGLDPVISAEINQLILQINKRIGATIVIVTHDLDSIFKVAQRVVMLDKMTKGIIAEGEPRFLKDNSPNMYVRQFFNRETDIT